MNGIPEAERPDAQSRPEPLHQQAVEEHHAPVEEASIPVAAPPNTIDPELATAPPPSSFLGTYASQPLPPPIRFPNFGDVGLVVVFLVFGWIGSGALLGTALHFRLWGVSNVKQALNDIHYALGSQAIWYLISFTGCILLFPAIWRTGYFEGLEWNAGAAFRKRWRLFTAAFVCFLLAIADGVLLPGPPDTPIDQVFRMPGAAWLLFAFGITLAPFFEEMAFRGFLLPAFNTAVDWAAERTMHRPAPAPDEEGKTRWSIGAMVVGSVLTSIPFALMHAEQTGYSLGPFLLLICVSLVLCWVRLSMRSLAASTLVHSSYNLLLFSLMLAGTGGFKHLDKM